MFEKYDAYKDSGVEWLGQLPESWDLLPNKYIFKLKKNLVGKRSKEYELLSLTLNGVIKRDMENPEGKFPAEFDTYQEVKSGDFIFCHFDVEETPRTVGLSKFDGMITGAYTVYQVNAEKFCPKFLYYFYLNLDTGKRLKPLYKGLRNTIGKDIFGEFKTFIPNYSEQVKISNFLDQKATEIDQAIAIKEQQIALLNERKQIVIQKAVTQGLDPNVPMKDSGVEWIGQIPEHWQVLKFKRACQFIYDGTHGSYPRVEQGYRLLSVRNIIDNEFVFREDDSCVSQKHFKEISSKFLIRNDDIQLAIVGGTLGKAAIVKNLEEDIVTQRSLATLRTQPKVLNPNFLLSFIRSPKYQNFLWSNAGFSAQPGVYLNTIQNSYLCMPCLKEQNLITEYIESETTKFSYLIGNIKEQIEKLKEYKTTLINDAVTGKIKVA